MTIQLKTLKKFIFNYDETYLNIANPPKTAIRTKASINVEIRCKETLYENITLGFIISADGAFLRPLIIAKGKTLKCLVKYDIDDKFIGTYTKDGWTNDECIKLVIDSIYSITKKQKGVLLLDQCH